MTTSRLFSVCMQSLWIIFGLCGASGSELVLAKTTRYELTATMGNANLSGKMAVDWALMINGGIPGGADLGLSGGEGRNS